MRTTPRRNQPGFATRAIHHGYDPQDENGALIQPIYMTSTFAFASAEDGMAIFAGEKPGFRYSRSGTPTTALLEKRLATLEGAEAGLVTSSGMGAIASVAWTLLKAGDEVVVDKTLYGCTFSLFSQGLAKFGVTARFVDMCDLASVEAAVGGKTAMVFFETPANPNMRIIDIGAVARVAKAKRKDVAVVVDNTYCTPYLQRPIEHGADFVVHSVTKYLGGHGDLIAGAVVGPAEGVRQVRMNGIRNLTGAVMSGMDAFLVMRGLKTLELRMDRHCASALALARMIDAHPAVAHVDHPGLESSPYHELARRQMDGFGGMIAFELKGGFEAGIRFMNSVQMVARAVSLGDAETLVQHPASMTHRSYPAAERAAYGISDGLIRLSVGLETLADLEADIGDALDAAGSRAAAE